MNLQDVLDLVLYCVHLVYCIVETLVLTLAPKRLRYKSVEGEIVLVTGGAGGLGRGLAVKFAKLGAKVVVWDVDKEGADETVAMITKDGGKAYGYQCDLSNREEIYQQAKKVQEEVGKVNILINNAGICSRQLFLDIPDESIMKTFEVNTLAHFWTAKAFLPDMMEANHGHIVTVSSLAGIVAAPACVDYCATKFAALGFDESLTLELQATGKTGIFNTAVCSYIINTGMHRGSTPKVMSILEPNDAVEEIVAGILCNEKTVYIPRYVRWILPYKYLFPSKSCTTLVNNVFGAAARLNNISPVKKSV